MKKQLARLATAVGVLATPAIASAQGVINLKDIQNIGNLISPIRPTGDGFNLANLVVTVFNYLIIIAGVLALFYLIWAGITYITAGSNDDKAKEAKSGIFNAIIGIVVILISYLIISWVSGLVRTTVPSSGNANQDPLIRQVQ